MNRFRYRLRTLVLSTGVIALILAGVAMILRSKHFQSRATSMAANEALCHQLALGAVIDAIARRDAGGSTNNSMAPEISEPSNSRAEIYEEAARQFARASAAFRYAASHPWVIEPREPVFPE